MRRGTPTNIATSVAATVAGFLLASAVSDGGAEAAGVPVVLWCAAIAFGLNWVAFVPAALARTERFYDLAGSAAHVATIATALALSPDVGPAGWLCGALVTVWAIRLGVFLSRRVRRAGHDRRFDTIKADPSSFFMAWTLQGLWIVATQAAALATVTGSDSRLGVAALIGTSVWLAGFGIEVVADAQKSAFRAEESNRERFISHGLWSRSRHPNYFGEILLWVGIAVITVPTLAGWRWLAVVSPLFVYALLSRGSGIPLLEARARRTWGDQPDYQHYLATTPRLFPRLRALDEAEQHARS
jgi:steroid 5-alpha reductase family enzyme